MKVTARALEANTTAPSSVEYMFAIDVVFAVVYSVETVDKIGHPSCNGDWAMLLAL